MSYPGGKHGSGVYQQIINRIQPENKPRLKKEKKQNHRRKESKCGKN